MTKKPNPQQLSMIAAACLNTDNIEEHKRIFCQRYDECLVAAAKVRWANWHCRDCEAFVSIPKETLQAEGARLSVAAYELGKLTP